ncbi:MAG TPA: RNA methyltransferase [Solirubrobacteraceae bacterium]|jgi:TrmH family RNA methyltransferase|nr:RNA methyltransferase [Solirubrobacteraceae bacterium]
MTITSNTNQHIKEIRKLGRASVRAKTGRFVAEGEDLYEAAHAAGREPLYALCAPGLARGRANFVEASSEVLSQASRLGSGTRVLGVYEQAWGAVSGPLALALWGVGDPGNVGTIVRAAHAFGAASVAFGPDCADPYGPKAVRASMGAIFSIRLARVESIAELPGRVIALAPGHHSPLRGPLTATTLLVGGERAGLPAEVLGACDEVRAIAQAGGESLNAAMAATVALYEATRMASR